MMSKAKSAARRLEGMRNAKGRLSLLPSLRLLFIAGTQMSNLVRHDQQDRRNYHHHHKAEASALSLSLSLSLSPIWLGLFKTEKEENHKKHPKKKPRIKSDYKSIASRHGVCNKNHYTSNNTGRRGWIGPPGTIRSRAAIRARVPQKRSSRYQG